MYRIVAITAGGAMLAGITMGAASAATCDRRIAGSCPIEPIAAPANASVEAAPAKPRAHARTGKQRSVRRAGRSARHLSSAERRRTAAIVARAMEREQRREREPSRADRQPRAETAAASPVATTPPAVAPVLTPTLVQTVDVRRPRPEASAPAVPDAQAAATTVPEQRATAAPEQQAAATENVDQAPAPPPAIAQAGDRAAASAPPQSELIRASVSGPPVDDSPPWLRFAFLAFGGLLALGSAIRLFV
jgi:hypothetical protein